MKTNWSGWFYGGLALVMVTASWIGWMLSSNGGSAAGQQAPWARNQIDVCVDVAPDIRSAVSPDAAAQRLESAIESALRSPQAVELGVDRLQSRVLRQCPHGYVSPPADARQVFAAGSIRGRVDQPMSISTLVFVVADEEAAKLSPVGYARAAYESMCEGTVCMEVTTALFVPRSTLESPAALQTAMMVGLGIDPTGGRYPDGHLPEADTQTK